MSNIMTFNVKKKYYENIKYKKYKNIMKCFGK